ncbi:MAG: glycosyltransferase family 4 protein, partial [Phycisphaerae bacterium]
MKIGLVSPFLPHDLADLMDARSRGDLLHIQGVAAPSVSPMVREWHRRGHEISIFSLDQSLSSPHHLQGERLSIHMLPKRRNRECLLDCYRAECRLIRAAVERESPVVLHAQWTYEHALAALKCNLPTAVTCHDSPLRCAWIQKHWHMTYHLFIAWKVIRNADRLICVSPYTAQHIQKYFKPRCPVNIIPNGLMPNVFLRGQRRLSIGLRKENPFTICSVGCWGGLKNITTLLKAFAIAHNMHRSTKLVLFGRGLGPGEAGEQWAIRRQLHRGVVFKGNTQRNVILDFLETEADLMAHPSLNEAHGMVLIEAMACGVPVIGGSQSGAVPWTLDEGRCGFLCDVRDEMLLAQTILKAIN